MEPSTNNAQPTQEVSIQEQLNLQQEALAKIYVSVEKTRKIMLWTGIASIVFFVLPLIVVAFAFPLIMNTFTSSLSPFTESSDTQQAIDQPRLSESLDQLNELFGN